MLGAGQGFTEMDKFGKRFRRDVGRISLEPDFYRDVGTIYLQANLLAFFRR